MYAFRCTEQQLNDSLKQIEEAGDTLFSAEFKGGRDWMLFCIKAAQPAAQPVGQPAYASQIQSCIDTLVAINGQLSQIGHSVNRAAVNNRKAAL